MHQKRKTNTKVHQKITLTHRLSVMLVFIELLNPATDCSTTCGMCPWGFRKACSTRTNAAMRDTRHTIETFVSNVGPLVKSWSTAKTVLVLYTIHCFVKQQPQLVLQRKITHLRMRGYQLAFPTYQSHPAVHAALLDPVHLPYPGSEPTSHTKLLVFCHT